MFKSLSPVFGHIADSTMIAGCLIDTVAARIGSIILLFLLVSLVLTLIRDARSDSPKGQNMDKQNKRQPWQDRAAELAQGNGFTYPSETSQDGAGYGVYDPTHEVKPLVTPERTAAEYRSDVAYVRKSLGINADLFAGQPRGVMSPYQQGQYHFGWGSTEWTKDANGTGITRSTTWADYDAALIAQGITPTLVTPFAMGAGH